LGRSEAAQFSFLMSIPVIMAAGTLKLTDLSQSALPVDWVVFAVGVLVAAVSALAVIAGFLKVIERVGVLPFVIYRVALGALIFFWFW
jgi:undecaprenyl-diphosphatase